MRKVTSARGGKLSMQQTVHLRFPSGVESGLWRLSALCYHSFHFILDHFQGHDQKVYALILLIAGSSIVVIVVHVHVDVQIHVQGKIGPGVVILSKRRCRVFRRRPKRNDLGREHLHDKVLLQLWCVVVKSLHPVNHGIQCRLWRVLRQCLQLA